MIELTLNGVAVDLTQGEQVVVDYAIAPLSNISTRKAASSFSFSLPTNAKNLAAIENSNQVNNVSTFPYSIIEARLTVNGVDQGMRFASIEGVTNLIKVRLYGSNIDFFAKIKGLKLSGLDLSALDHFHYMDDIELLVATTTGAVYAAIDNHSDSPNSSIDNLTRSINVKYLLPCVYLHTLISQIATDAGFTLAGNVLTDANYLNAIVQAREYVYHSTADFTTSTAFTLTGVDIVIFRWSGSANLTLKAGTEITITKDSDGTYIHGYLTADASLVIPRSPQFTIDFNNSAIVYQGNSTFIGMVFGSGYTVAIRNIIENVTTDNTFTNFVIDYSLSGASFFPILGRAVGIGYRGFLDIAGSMGSMTQSDLVKVVAQMFGLIIDTNPETKVITLYQLSDIIARKSSGYDWSDKLDRTDTPSIKFRTSKYAQVNEATYKDQEGVDKQPGTDYFFNIPDENLPSSKVLFKSPFSATRWKSRFIGLLIPQIKIFEGAGTSDESISKTSPRILLIRSYALALTYTDGSLTKVQNPFKTGYFVDAAFSFDLGWKSMIATYSTDLVALLANMKIITEKIRLNESDINQLDLINPVWLDAHDAWFMISSIKHSHTSQESSTVELVKI